MACRWHRNGRVQLEDELSLVGVASIRELRVDRLWSGRVRPSAVGLACRSDFPLRRPVDVRPKTGTICVGGAGIGAGTGDTRDEADTAVWDVLANADSGGGERGYDMPFDRTFRCRLDHGASDPEVSSSAARAGSGLPMVRISVRRRGTSANVSLSCWGCTFVRRCRRVAASGIGGYATRRSRRPRGCCTRSTTARMLSRQVVAC
jgi:hypothetical protein